MTISPGDCIVLSVMDAGSWVQDWTNWYSLYRSHVGSSAELPSFPIRLFMYVMNSLVASLTAVALSSELLASRSVGVALSSEQQDRQGIPSGLLLLESRLPKGKRSRTEKTSDASAEENIGRSN